MDNCSFFIEDKALFGSFPVQEEVELLEEKGVRYFINLSDLVKESYKIKPYNTKYGYINYPIRDHDVPTNLKSFSILILNLVSIINNLKDGEYIYVHCVAGCGRSGVVVASILANYYKMNPIDALKYTQHYHGKRPVMKEKLRRAGSPQTLVQKKFIHNFFKPFTMYYNDPNIPFSNYADINVFVPQIGFFPTGEAAFQAFKNIKNAKYVMSLKKSNSPEEATMIGKDKEWNGNEKVEFLAYIITLKLLQHNNVRNSLIDLYLRPTYCDDNEYAIVIRILINELLRNED